MLRNLVTALLAVLALPALAAPIGTAITYQGHLTDAQEPATGLYDFQLCAFDQLAGGTLLGCATAFDKVPVEAGIFTVDADFGAIFNGQARFLEIRVRDGDAAGNDPYTVLAPRQRLSAAPESLHSIGASTAPWSGVTGIPVDLLDGDGLGVVSVTPGFGLVTAPPITNQGTVAVDPSVIQRRVGQTCSTGAIAAIAQSGAVTCTSVVSSVAAGAGLTAGQAGPIVGSGTLSIADGGVGAQQINVQQVQRRINASCQPGHYMRAVAQDGTPTCEQLPVGGAGAATLVVLDDPFNLVGDFSSMAIGLDGSPVVSYYDSTADALKVAKCSNSTCTGAITISTVDDGQNDVGRYNSIAVRSNGLPIISYHDATLGTVRVASCNDAACTSAQINVIADPNIVGRFTAIGVNGSGTIFIAYQDIALAALKVATCLDQACANASINIVDDHATNTIGAGISMVVDDAPGALPNIAYIDFTLGALKFARCSTAECATSSSVTLATTGVDGETSIALRPPLSLPIVSYHDSAAGSLKVASCMNTACSGTITLSELEDSVGTFGRFSSIAVGKDGLARISFIDSVNTALRFGKCNDARCTSFSLVSNIDDTGSFDNRPTTLRMRSDGIPLIAYSDTGGRMLFMACGTGSCQ